MSNIEAAASAATANVAPWIERLARLGYISIGTVYTIVGSLTAAAAFGGGNTGRAADSRSAFAFIVEKPFGRVLMGLVALGLFGYAAWRIISAITDGERRGSKPKGIAIRIGSFFRGLVYAAITLEAARLALGGAGRSGGGDQKAQHWISRLMEKPFGWWLVAAAGLSIIGYGIYQLYRAWKAKLGKQLHLPYMTDQFRKRLVAISRFGIAARAIVFLVIGYSIARAGWLGNPDESRGTSGALQELGQASQWLLGIIAIGLIAFGIYQFINARYRRIAAT